MTRHRKRNATENKGRHYGQARADRFQARALSPKAKARKKARRKLARQSRRTAR